jgi:hypothetical protein
MATDEEVDARFERAEELLHRAGHYWDAKPDLCLGDAARAFVSELSPEDKELLASEYVVSSLFAVDHEDDEDETDLPLLN